MSPTAICKSKAIVPILLRAALVVLLAAAYFTALFFSPQRQASRSDSYLWLEPAWAEQADRIELYGTEAVALVKRTDASGQAWTIAGSNTYPVKQARVDELLNALSSRRLYPAQRATNPGLESLGLSENRAYHIIVRGGAGAVPLLDLMLGYHDASGQNIYLKNAADSTVRLGEDIFSGFLEGGAAAWYYLKLLQNQGAPQLGIHDVSRIRLYRPEETIIARSGSGWTLSGAAIPGLETNALIETYIRRVLEAEGSGWTTAVSVSDPAFNGSTKRIVIEFADGSIKTITLGPLVEGIYTASVSTSPYVYTLSDWTVKQLFDIL